VSEAGTLAPFHDAVTVAEALAAKTPVVAINVVDVCPEAMETFDGTVTAALLLLIETVAPFAEALESDTVQVLSELLPKVDGEQARELSCAVAVTISIVELCELPL
jgi:hypothetical protein